jgi:hypothetical protein
MSALNALLSGAYDPSSLALFGRITGTLAGLYIDTRLAVAAAGAAGDDDDSDGSDDEGGDVGDGGGGGGGGGAGGAGTASHDEMASAAALARLHLPAVCDRLARGLEETTAGLRAATEGKVSHADLIRCFECAEWLMRFSGHVLADPSDGEIPTVPTAIQAHGDTAAQQQPGTPPHPVLRLTEACLRLSEAESACLATGDPNLASPAVARAVAWFLARWQATYLAPDPALYAPPHQGAGATADPSANQAAHHRPPLPPFPAALIPSDQRAALAHVVGKGATVAVWPRLDQDTCVAVASVLLAIAKRCGSGEAGEQFARMVAGCREWSAVTVHAVQVVRVQWV